MAVDKAIDSTKLNACCTAEANAIRAKTGGSAQLVYDYTNDKGFADAIAAIPTGGGDSQLKSMIDGSITSVNSDVTTIRSHAFENCTSLTTASFPNATSAGTYVFSGCTSLASVSLDSLVTGGTYMFSGCTALTTVNLPSLTQYGSYFFQNCRSLTAINSNAATSLGNSTFDGCNHLTSVSLNKVTSIGGSAFNNCYCLQDVSFEKTTSIGSSAFQNTSIGTLELPAATTLNSSMISGASTNIVDLSAKCTIPATAFNSAHSLIALILRDTSGVRTLSNTNAFTGTPIAVGKGLIYVPADLVNSYKSASNWANYANQIVSLALYPKALTDIGFTETITDSWSDIVAASGDGTYSSKYSLGDTKWYTGKDGTSHLMQLIAIDKDELSDNTGYASMTWLRVSSLKSQYMNPTSTTEGGWVSSYMRDYLYDCVLPNLPDAIADNVKEVKKTYKVATPSSRTRTSNDTIWIPSYCEMFGGTSVENSGVTYTSFFTDNASRIKRTGLLDTSDVYWGLRSASGSTTFYNVSSSGGSSSSVSASTAIGVVFGFCL